MAQFKNTTLHAIPIVINGVRKTIRPGEVFHGPDSLSSIPGITILNSQNKIVNTIVTVPEKIAFNAKAVENINFENGVSNFTVLVNEQLEYLTYMKNLGDNPSVSIAILTKNRYELINNCCESIFDKIKYKNLTLVIIDTGSTEEPVKNYYLTLTKKCEERKWKYKYIQLDTFHFSKNYNTAIKNHIDTEYVIIQNNDTVALNDYVTEMMNTGLISKSGSVGCRMLYPDKISIQHDGQTIFNAPNEQYGSASHVNLRQRKDKVPPEQGYTHFVEGNTAACVLMRTKDFVKIEGFEEKFNDIFQDVHLMIKIPQLLNKYNFCNRIANIIHIDNASRLQTGVDQKKHIQMWEDTHYLRKSLLEKQWFKLKKPKQVDFSIITPVYNLETYKEFLENLKTQIGNHTIEIIAIPNFYNHFNSAYKALNSGSDVASGNILIYCHDDIIIPNDWLTRIKNKVNELDSSYSPLGVIGPAGISMREEGVYYLLDNRGEKIPTYVIDQQNNYNHLKAIDKMEVQTLDELCLITLRKNNLRFDDNLLHGWHFYGANLCLKAIQKGLHNWAIDCYCHHRSDGNKNLNTMEKWTEYETNAKEFNAWTKTIGINKWRTTTAKSFNNTVSLFPKKPNS